MSDLAKGLGVPRTDVIPGYTCARATLEDYGMAEEEFERRHIRKAAEACVGLPEDSQRRVIAAATNDVANGRFKYGLYPFDAIAYSPTSYGFLLYLLLRHNHPDMTPPKAGALLTEENRHMAGRKILEQFGYDFSKKAEPGNAEAGALQPGPS